ncbi:MAG: GAF domain-containing protein, partial [Planctomycetales bacterium]
MDKRTEDLATDELRRRLASFDVLIEATRNLAAEIDLETILSLIAEESRQAVDCERASVFLFDAAAGELFTRVVTELEISEIRHGVEQGVTGFAARARQTVNVPVPSEDPRWNRSVDLATGYHTNNILAVPIVSPQGETLLGVLELINKRDRAFDEFDEQLAQAFSQHAAVALHRARLVEELRKQQAVEVSLNVAREIQRGFMPNALPETPGYEVAT